MVPEAGFGPCGMLFSAQPNVFPDLEAATQGVRQRLEMHQHRSWAGP
jgi:hypothetical protein